jgi:hypothetical protein
MRVKTHVLNGFPPHRRRSGQPWSPAPFRRYIADVREADLVGFNAKVQQRLQMPARR